MIKHDPKIYLDKTLIDSHPKKATQCKKKKKSSCKKNINSSSNKELGFSSKFKKITDLNQQHHFFKITKVQGFLNNRARRLLGEKTAQQKHFYCEKCLPIFDPNPKRKNMKKLAAINNVPCICPRILP